MKKIALVGKKGAGKFAIVDDEDFDKVSGLKWYYHSGGYAHNVQHVIGSDGVRIAVYLHRLLMNPPDRKLVDHINHDKLDNRKMNLRVCSHEENRCNNKQKVGTSGFRGVYWNRIKWVARISYNRKRISLGSYWTKEEAALAWNEAAKKYHGEFAVLNEVQFP